MACAKCSKHKKLAEEQFLTDVVTTELLRAKDMVIITPGNEARNTTKADWQSRYKLLIFIPEAFTPVCTTEIGAMHLWYDEFMKLDCEIILCSSDSVPKLQDWLDQEPSLSSRKYNTLSSYELPKKLDLLRGSRAKRASVFVMPDEVVKQEHFDKVGRSFEELHRMLWAYTQDTYCGEGWKSPSDNMGKV